MPRPLATPILRLRSLALVTHSTHAKGAHWEHVAAGFLARLGWEIVARNWRCPEGELDIVARDGEELVFVEVRARSDRAGYRAEETIGRRKIGRLAVAASRYVDESEWEGPCRFDVVAIAIGDTGHDVRLLRDAFIPG